MDKKHLLKKSISKVGTLKNSFVRNHARTRAAEQTSVEDRSRAASVKDKHGRAQHLAPKQRRRRNRGATEIRRTRLVEGKEKRPDTPSEFTLL